MLDFMVRCCYEQPNTQAVKSPLFSCLQLLITYFHIYLHIWRPSVCRLRSFHANNINLYKDLTTFSLLWAALVIHVFVEGNKNINNTMESM